MTRLLLLSLLLCAGACGTKEPPVVVDPSKGQAVEIASSSGGFNATCWLNGSEERLNNSRPCDKMMELVTGMAYASRAGTKASDAEWNELEARIEADIRKHFVEIDNCSPMGSSTDGSYFCYVKGAPK